MYCAGKHLYLRPGVQEFLLRKLFKVQVKLLPPPPRFPHAHCPEGTWDALGVLGGGKAGGRSLPELLLPDGAADTVPAWMLSEQADRDLPGNRCPQEGFPLVEGSVGLSFTSCSAVLYFIKFPK